MSDKPAAKARIDWRGADMRGLSMAGVTLEHVDFRGADLSNANLSGAILRYNDFRGATLRGANFQNSNLYGSKMQGVEAEGADFRGANLQMVNLGGAYLDGAILPAPSAEKQPSPSEIAASQPRQKPEPERGKDASRANGQDKGPPHDNEHRRGR